MGGWESAEMVRRYAHLDAEHLAPYADNLRALRTIESKYGTNLSHAKNEKALVVYKPLI